MFKAISYFLGLFCLSCYLLFGDMQGTSSGPSFGPPPRQDKLDSTSNSAQIVLKRAERILSTLVFDPQNYQLILSSKSVFGGEAVSPCVYSDKPTMIIYQGALSPNRSNEEIAFMMAHELGHLNLYHNEKMNEQMGKIFQGPTVGISGTTFAVFFQKFQEREADMFGLYLYKQAGYDIGFFPFTLGILNINPNIHFGSSMIFAKSPSSLSMRDSHFSMKERFELLVSESQNPV